MRLLSFKRIENKSNKYSIDPDGEEDWFVQLESDSEKFMYEECMVNKRDENHWWMWYGYMSAKLGGLYSDDDMFYYFTFEDRIPAIGEKWKLDDLVFERVK